MRKIFPYKLRFEKAAPGRSRKKNNLTEFLPIEENDYPFKSHRYIAMEKKVVSWLCAQDRIEPNHITLFRFLICIKY